MRLTRIGVNIHGFSEDKYVNQLADQLELNSFVRSAKGDIGTFSLQRNTALIKIF